jgi:hypothetical protein
MIKVFGFTRSSSVHTGIDNTTVIDRTDLLKGHRM